MKIAILGAGSWGTALCIHLARVGHEVLLWARDKEVTAAIESTRRHPRRFPETPIPAVVRVTSDLAEAFAHSETMVLALPCEALRLVLEAGPTGSSRRRFVSTAKGIEPDTLMRMSEIILEYHRHASVAALSGPTFADGVVRRDPTAAVVAGSVEDFTKEVQQAFSSPQLRLYSSDDLIGVEFCGALKNVVAIAAGIVAGLGFGHNTLAALVTRGLAEIGRIVRGQGGQPRTVAGLAGIGDLLLTSTGQQSRNRRVGEQIGRGRRLAEILAEMPEVAEGVRTCLAMPRLAAQVGVEAPIAEAVVSVLYENVPAAQAVEGLMTRTLRAE